MGFWYKSLAVSYFRMVEHHTIIGAEQFHFRVRYGIGWFPLAMAARQTFYTAAFTQRSIFGQFLYVKSAGGVALALTSHPAFWVLYGQATRAISTP